MREIKFRAWIKEDKNMVIVQELYYAKRSEFGENFRIRPFGHNEVLRWWEHEFELMQYTGLRDKHDKEIYESDLIRDGGGFLWEVNFSSGKFYLLSKEKDIRPDMDINTGLAHCQVIGNIYESPKAI